MNVAIILAGGVGKRLGATIPKQYIKVNHRPIIAYVLDVFFGNSQIDAVWIVADFAWRNQIEKEISKQNDKAKFGGFSNPGENRQLSILQALNDMQKYVKEDDFVIVHDAVRPCLSHTLLEKCILAAKEHDGAIPVVPMKDTVYFCEDGKKISHLLKRECLFAGQAPEVFLFGKYFAANCSLLPQKILQINGSTEPAILANMDIVTVPGEECNFKITTSEDLKRFCEEMEMRQ